MTKNIFEMSFRERRNYASTSYPGICMKRSTRSSGDDVTRDALGAHIYERFVEAKRGE